MKKLPIYFGCALLAGPMDYQKRIAIFKKRLSDIPWIKLFEFCVPPPGEKQSNLSPSEIYKNDILEGVGGSFVVLGDITYPSLGLGLEIGVAMREHKVRTMMFAQRLITENGKKVENVVSKLGIGSPFHNPHASFKWYEESLDELFDEIIYELKKAYERFQFNEILKT